MDVWVGLVVLAMLSIVPLTAAVVFWLETA